MRINSEEAMIKAIQAKRKDDVSWIELSRRARAQSKDELSEEPKTASRLAGA